MARSMNAAAQAGEKIGQDLPALLLQHAAHQGGGVGEIFGWIIM